MVVGGPVNGATQAVGKNVTALRIDDYPEIAAVVAGFQGLPGLAAVTRTKHRTPLRSQVHSAASVACHAVQMQLFRIVELVGPVFLRRRGKRLFQVSHALPRTSGALLVDSHLIGQPVALQCPGEAAVAAVQHIAIVTNGPTIQLIYKSQPRQHDRCRHLYLLPAVTLVGGNQDMAPFPNSDQVLTCFIHVQQHGALRPGQLHGVVDAIGARCQQRNQQQQDKA